MNKQVWIITAVFMTLVLVLAVLVVFKKAAAQKSGERSAPLKVVDRVDLARYAGTWYSIASIPQFFDKACAGGTTATYTARPAGDLEVKNVCYRKDGSRYDAKGRAWVVDQETNARLKVSFLPGGLKIDRLAGDYWIIDLGENYEYAVVGHPDRSYGWILSRARELPEDVMQGIIQRLETQGYDFNDFEMVNQKDFPKK